MPPIIYREEDANLQDLEGRTCAIIGFGNQGKAQALNLQESGVDLIIGLHAQSKSRAVAKKLGFEVLTTAQAARRADVMLLALSDPKIPAIFNHDIAPWLTPGKTLIFAHGFAIHYQTIRPDPQINVVMVAPKGPGDLLRRQFVQGKGIPALLALHEDPSKTSKKIALAWAKGIGSTRAAVFETTFAEETETDLFGEQAILCGGLSALIYAAFETLVDHGYQPEIAYFEVLDELKLTVDLIHRVGISGMRSAISQTAKYGDLTVGPKIIDASVKKRMRGALERIRSGKFAKEWIEEEKRGLKNYHLLLAQGEKHPLEEVGKSVRRIVHYPEKSTL